MSKPLSLSSFFRCARFIPLPSTWVSLPVYRRLPVFKPWKRAARICLGFLPWAEERVAQELVDPKAMTSPIRDWINLKEQIKKRRRKRKLWKSSQDSACIDILSSRFIFRRLHNSYSFPSQPGSHLHFEFRSKYYVESVKTSVTKSRLKLVLWYQISKNVFHPHSIDTKKTTENHDKRHRDRGQIIKEQTRKKRSNQTKQSRKTPPMIRERKPSHLRSSSCLAASSPAASS